MPRTETPNFSKKSCKTFSISVYKRDILKNKYIALKTSLTLTALLCHSLIQISFITSFFSPFCLFQTNVQLNCSLLNYHALQLTSKTSFSKMKYVLGQGGGMFLHFQSKLMSTHDRKDPNFEGHIFLNIQSSQHLWLWKSIVVNFTIILRKTNPSTIEWVHMIKF